MMRNKKSLCLQGWAVFRLKVRLSKNTTYEHLPHF
jgi:hypothetical protein